MSKVGGLRRYEPMRIVWVDVRDLGSAVAVRFACDLDCGGAAVWGARVEPAGADGQMVLLLGSGCETVSRRVAADDQAGVYGGGDLSGERSGGVADCARGRVCEPVDGAAWAVEPLAQ